MQIRFSKYHGTGNDFVLIDDRSGAHGVRLTSDHVRRLCDRRLGIGADGLILLTESGTADLGMVYFNADGNEGTFCGNGSRCLTAFAHRLGVLESKLTIEAVDGIHAATIDDDAIVSVQIQSPTDYKALSDTEAYIHTGSPHHVCFVNNDLQAVDVMTLGNKIRRAAEYSPMGGTNVNFVQVAGEDSLLVRTYERGVENETLSCGTGVTASAYVYLLGRDANKPNSDDVTVAVSTRGGDLCVRFSDFQAAAENIWLTGAATLVFEGTVTV